MNRHILLINPWIHDFSAYDLWYKPLGLLSLGSILRSQGARITFIDCLAAGDRDVGPGRHIRPARIKPSGDGTYTAERIAKPDPLKAIPRHFHRFGMPPETFRKALAAIGRPDLILITSMMTYWYPGLFETVAIAKTAHPGIPVAVGGNYVTLCPLHARRSGADFCLPGPGEASLPPLLNDLFGCTMDSSREGERDLDSYPYPAFDLVHPLHYIPLLTSRGCPYRCSYCASPLLNRVFRRRDPIAVADEILFWHNRFGVRHFSFYDDALLADAPSMAIPLLNEIIRRDLPVQFHCPNGLHLREITAELSHLMFRGGLRTIRFGFETSNPIRQRETGGKISTAELIEAVGHLRRAGYRSQQIGVYLLCGLPGQSRDEIHQSIRLVQDSGATPLLAEYSPIPGTGLWEEALASSPHPIAEEPLFQNNTLLPCKSSSLTIPAYQALKQMTRSHTQVIRNEE